LSYPAKDPDPANDDDDGAANAERRRFSGAEERRAKEAAVRVDGARAATERAAAGKFMGA